MAGLESEGPARPTGQADRGVTDADHALSKDPLHRLGDHPGGVGEVDDPRPRAYGCYPRSDVDRHRHGAQPVRDAARAGRLLTEQAQVEGDAFVRGAALEATDPDRGEHERGIAKRVVQVGGASAPSARRQYLRPSRSRTMLMPAAAAGPRRGAPPRSTRRRSGVAQQCAMTSGTRKPPPPRMVRITQRTVRRLPACPTHGTADTVAALVDLHGTWRSP